MKILSIIPARAGSKGLKDKNIVNLAGKPLLAWSIESSLKSKYINKTIVSSDDTKILEIAKKYGADILIRPKNLARDITPTEPVVEHVLQSIKNIKEYNYLILLQPTSPLRSEIDIDSSIELLLEKKVSALISVKEIDNKILKAFINNTNGYLEGVSNNEFPFARRQDLPKVYMPNGAIYIIEINEFLRTKKLFSSKTIPYIMSDERSLDIDTLEDLDICNKYIIRNFREH